MSKYEWDENKNISNQEKHKFSFEDATDVFNDEERLKFSSDKNGEARILTIGKAFQMIVSVVYTTRDLVIRIISARRSNKKERRVYLSHKLSKQDDDKG